MADTLRRTHPSLRPRRRKHAPVRLHSSVARLTQRHKVLVRVIPGGRPSKQVVDTEMILAATLDAAVAVAGQDTHTGPSPVHSAQAVVPFCARLSAKVFHVLIAAGHRAALSFLRGRGWLEGLEANHTRQGRARPPCQTAALAATVFPLLCHAPQDLERLLALGARQCDSASLEAARGHVAVPALRRTKARVRPPAISHPGHKPAAASLAGKLGLGAVSDPCWHGANITATEGCVHG